MEGLFVPQTFQAIHQLFPLTVQPKIYRQQRHNPHYRNNASNKKTENEKTIRWLSTRKRVRLNM